MKSRSPLAKALLSGREVARGGKGIPHDPHEEEPSLSPFVASLYYYDGSEEGDEVIRPDGFLDFSAMCRRVSPGVGSTMYEYRRGKDADPAYREAYTTASRRLHGVARDVHRYLRKQDVVKLYRSSASVFPLKIFEDVLHQYRDAEDLEDDMLCCMQCISFFERSLTEILVLTGSRDLTARNLKITDILQTPALCRVLGYETLFVLQAFIGPLYGLNLRNMLWHNFIPTGHWRPYFTSLMVAIAASLPYSFHLRGAPLATWFARMRLTPEAVEAIQDEAARHLLLRGVHTLPGPAQPPATSTFVEGGHPSNPSLNDTSGRAPATHLHVSERRVISHKGGPLFDVAGWMAYMQQRHQADFSVPPLPPLDEAVKIIDSSPFFVPSRRSAWRKAVTLYYKEDWSRSTMLTTVLMESALRRMYAVANNADERWQTTDQDELFLTIDDILTPAHNALFYDGWLTPQSTALLGDHWAWQDGLHLRDDMAHGSLDPSTLNCHTIAPLLACAFHLAALVSRTPPFPFQYTPQFSPWALFVTELQHALDGGLAALERTCRLVAERGTGFPPPSSPATAVQHQNDRREGDPNTLPPLEEVEALIDLVRPPWKLEHPDIMALDKVLPANIVKMNTLRRVVVLGDEFGERITATYDSAYQLVMDRKAYKKQRVAYARLLMELPTLTAMVRLGVYFAAAELPRDPGGNDGAFRRERCYNYVNSLVSQTVRKQWARALPDFHLFAAYLRTAYA